MDDLAASDDIDLSAIERLHTMIHDDGVAELLGLFVRDAPPLVDAMKGGVERGDADRIRRAAHTLKSTSQILGMRGLGDLCRDIEAASREGDLSDAPARVALAARLLDGSLPTLRSLQERYGKA